MELLATLRKKEYLERLSGVTDGLIVGSDYTTAFHFRRKDLAKVSEYQKSVNKKLYVVMDNFIMEDEKIDVRDYINYLMSIDVDGIYFHDFGIYGMARTMKFPKELIYDGKTVLCNSLDSAFLISKGINGVVISRELTLDEVKEIARANKGRIDLQVFGHLRLSASKRRFLTNYFKEIRKDYHYFGKETLTLVEEQRDYRMPIIEDGNGTTIYSDYILEMFNELPSLKDTIRRGIVDTIFIDDLNLLCQLCRDYKRISEDNKDFIRQSFMNNYPGPYSSAYLYQKTNITKDE
jgi:putative protease